VVWDQGLPERLKEPKFEAHCDQQNNHSPEEQAGDMQGQWRSGQASKIPGYCSVKRREKVSKDGHWPGVNYSIQVKMSKEATGAQNRKQLSHLHIPQ
jgi:hypothetical protein